MTSAVFVAVLLSAGPEAGADAVLVRARQAMLGDARLPWLLLASGSIDRSGGKSSERFALEWEPCQQRRDVRGHFSRTADDLLYAAIGGLCRNDPIAAARVERNGAHVRYVWKTGDRYHSNRVTIEVDPDTGILSRTQLQRSGLRYDSKSQKLVKWSGLVGTAELSDFRPVGTMRLPHRLQLQAGRVREEWTIERIEIVPLP